MLQVLRVDSPTALATIREAALPTAAPVGSSLDVDLEVSGSNPVTLKARTRTSDAAATDAWQLQTSDGSARALTAPGLAGMHAYLSRSAPHSITLTTTELTATAVTTPTPPILPTPPTPTGAGSAPVGLTSYAVPSGAMFVATTGRDTNPGSSSAPKRTMGAAIAAAPARGTIVIRGGTHHESVIVPSSKPLTIQSYPREAV